VTFAAAATTAGPPTKKRKRMVFANKKLSGHRELFLSPEFLNRFTDENAKIAGAASGSSCTSSCSSSESDSYSSFDRVLRRVAVVALWDCESAETVDLARALAVLDDVLTNAAATVAMGGLMMVGMGVLLAHFRRPTL